MDSPSNITTTLHHHHQKQPFTLSPPPPPTTFSRYEDQKRRNWNTFGQYLKNHRPPLSLERCSGAHVLEFLRYLDQFGKTKVHTQLCPFYGHPSPPAPCPCPLRQAWGSLDALAGRLRAAYEENGGKPETNPFGARAVTLYLREVRDSQSKARGVSYEKNRKRKRVPQPNHNHNHNRRENNKFCYSIKQQITGDPLNQSSMDEPCEICGDTGYVDAILICSKCKVTRAHRYCMFKMPEADQEIWVCDECDSSQRPSFKQARSEEPSGTKMRFMIKKPPQSSKVQYLTPEAVKGLESGIMRNSSASPSKSYVARRPSVNWPVMSKMEAAPSSSVHPQVSIKPNPRVGPSGRREPLNNWSIPPALKCKKWSASTEKENLVSGWQDSPIPKQSSARTSQGLYTMKRKEINGPARQQCGESPTAKHVTFETLPEPVAESNNINLGHTRQSFQCLPPVSSVDDANQVCVDTPIAKCVPLDNFSKADINSMHTFHFVGFSPPMNSGINVCAEAQPKLIDLKGKSSRATMEFDSYLPNHPAVSPTWKGVLKIPSDVLPYSAINGIQAHPPCRVHSQVYKLSKQLPELLHFEVQRREGSWLEIFEDGVPVELDIGLYFLYPLNGDSGQSYCSLLDYLDGHDLILRTCLDGVELFVFSSYHLPENSRKINQKHYLWGLFRPYEVKNKAALASDVECLARVDSVHSSDSQHVQQQMSEVIDAEDMDIDMLGGPEVVGKVDIVVPKPMDNACVDQREGERGPSDEMKASPLSTEGSAVDFSSIKIKEECTDDMENPLSFTASCADYEVEFEKELQRSFDKFTALMQVEDLRSLKMDIKEEINSFC